MVAYCFEPVKNLVVILLALNNQNVSSYFAILKQNICHDNILAKNF